MSPSTTEIGVSLKSSGHKPRGRTLVGLALLLELASRLDGRFAPVLVQVLIAHDLTAHELVLEVRAIAPRQASSTTHTIAKHSLDDTGRLGRLQTLADGPCADLVGPASEVTDEVERGVASGGDLRERADRADVLLFLGETSERRGTCQCGESSSALPSRSADEFARLDIDSDAIAPVASLAELLAMDISDGLGSGLPVSSCCRLR